MAQRNATWFGYSTCEVDKERGRCDVSQMYIPAALPGTDGRK